MYMQQNENPIVSVKKKKFLRWGLQRLKGNHKELSFYAKIKLQQKVITNLTSASFN